MKSKFAILSGSTLPRFAKVSSFCSDKSSDILLLFIYFQNLAKTGPFCIFLFFSNNIFVGANPGLVVMGGDSCSEGCGLESQHSISTGWMFFTLI